MKKINKIELHEVFEDLKNNKKDAYNRLYENYYSLIYGIVFSIIKNKDDSEDITHEVFTKIYKLDADKLPTNSEASWLFTVSKNECFLFLRKSKPNISIDEIYEMPATSNEIDNVIDVEYFNKTISGLKEEEKIIVSLKVLSNFTFKKISQVMNIPIGTVQWKYYNAINALKVSLGGLTGAVVAFVLAFANGVFWRKENVFNKATSEDEDKENSDYSHNKDTADSSNKSVISSEIPDTNTSENINVGEEGRATAPYESIGYEVSSGNNFRGLTGIQPIFLTIGIVLFVISLLFFKIYQQKLRNKASK